MYIILKNNIDPLKIMATQSNDNDNNNTNNSSLQKDQIPTEFNEEQTQRVVRKQHRISGEARDKNHL